MKKVNVAVVGAGAWGVNLIRNLHALGTLKAIVDSNPQRRQKICNQFVVDGCTHFRSVLERPNIDAVVIAIPALTMEALETGKDVMVLILE